MYFSLMAPESSSSSHPAQSMVASGDIVYYEGGIVKGARAPHNNRVKTAGVRGDQSPSCPLPGHASGLVSLSFSPLSSRSWVV